MPVIEIDDEVFAFLQRKAVPFVDDPNGVLRRLLLTAPEPQPRSRSTQRSISAERAQSVNADRQTRDTNTFVQQVLDRHFGGDFKKIKGYQYLFESPDQILYFQNFNQSNSDALWYRLRSSALSALRESNKKTIVCLTNPSDNLFYAIPVDDIDHSSRLAGWARDDLEVNIDHANRCWRELDWTIAKYLHQRAI
ncbi:MAG TPA: hypothetical protein VK610_00160 [Rhodothermales bacterium]|nr:hypothetical protein [Rhodothermales bacterium]